MSELIGHAPGESLRIKDGEKLLFPQPGFLMGYTAVFGNELGRKLLDEYLSIFGSLSSAIDGSRINLIKTVFGYAKKEDLASGFKTVTPPELTEWETIELKTRRFASEKAFPRDIFVNLGGSTFVDPEVMEIEEKDGVLQSPLGEGGKVLHAGKSVMVTEDLWNNAPTRSYIDVLREKGYKFGTLPYVKNGGEDYGKRHFVHAHIDGHANLVLGNDSKTYLLFAESYARQGGKASKAIRGACDFAEVEGVEIDDQHLPHLAFNFVQLNDGSVIITKDGGGITDTLRELVGPKKIIETSIPIELFPSLTAGGIRCLTNFAPEKLISAIKK